MFLWAQSVYRLYSKISLRDILDFNAFIFTLLEKRLWDGSMNVYSYIVFHFF